MIQKGYFLNIKPKEIKSVYSKDICTAKFTAEFITITKSWKQPQCPPMGDG
jgi:hypothetical protein